MLILAPAAMRERHLAAGRHAARAVYVETERALAGGRSHGSREPAPTLGGTVPARTLAPRPSDTSGTHPRIVCSREVISEVGRGLAFNKIVD